MRGLDHRIIRLEGTFEGHQVQPPIQSHVCNLTEPSPLIMVARCLVLSINDPCLTSAGALP